MAVCKSNTVEIIFCRLGSLSYQLGLRLEPGRFRANRAAAFWGDLTNAK